MKNAEETQTHGEWLADFNKRLELIKAAWGFLGMSDCIQKQKNIAEKIIDLLEYAKSMKLFNGDAEEANWMKENLNFFSTKAGGTVLDFQWAFKDGSMITSKTHQIVQYETTNPNAYEGA